jgi:hypothetical protein
MAKLTHAFSAKSQSALAAALAVTFIAALGTGASAQGRGNDAYRAPDQGYGQPVDPPYQSQDGYQGQGQGQPYGNQNYGGNQPYSNQNSPNQGGYAGQARQDNSGGGYPPSGSGYGAGAYGGNGGRNDAYRAPSQQDAAGYGQPYSPPPVADQGPPPEQRYDDKNPNRGYYSKGEIVDKGRGFFGSISQGLASAIEYTYSKAGRPNGYILGEDGGGAFFAGLRYGEGTLYTKDAGDHRVFWQGPSLGYDIGGEGSKTMVLVYNLSDPADVFHRFGGVEGSAYVVGGVSVQFQKSGDVTLAVIRSGIGLRLGANVGYLKYSRQPTWNPF